MHFGDNRNACDLVRFFKASIIAALVNECPSAQIQLTILSQGLLKSTEYHSA